MDNYYISRAPRLLREFDKAVERVKGVLVSRYGVEATDNLIKGARREYEALIPQLPYIGGKQPFTQFIIFTAWFLAMYRVLQRRGETVEQVGVLIYELGGAFMSASPKFLQRLFGHMTFSRRYLRNLRKRAAELQRRQYPGDYVYEFVEGDGETYDYGVDYIECGTCKFLNEQGAPELAPYLCTADRLYSEAFGWGLVRTTTIAEGGEKCDFRFRKGGETRVAVPEPLQQYIEGKLKGD
jgi:hypothetical protein